MATQLEEQTGLLGSVTAPGQASVTPPQNTAPEPVKVPKMELPSENTVEGRVRSMLDPNNPLVQQARTQATQQAASRGLLNSSLAMTAADDAMYKAVLPIAQADAGLAGDISKITTQQKGNLDLAQIEAQYKGLTQASASAASIMNKATDVVAKIMENTSMDAAAKQAAIDIYSANTNKALQLIGAMAGDVGLVEFLDEVLA